MDSYFDFVSKRKEAGVSDEGLSTKRSKTRSRRHYIDSYLQYGVSWTGDSTLPLSLCLVNGTKVANKAMVLTKLRRHLHNQHSLLTDKTTAYFLRLSAQHAKQTRMVSDYTSLSNKGLELASLFLI